VTRLPRRAWLLLAALPPAALAARPAHAHAILVQSDPAHAARLPPGAHTLSLRFNSRLDRLRSRLTLTRPDRSQTVLALLDGPDDQLAAAVTLAPGAHTLRWQVLAIDGHITRGDLPFTVVAP
jgi:methionine-rich copper-binding protein CopC